MKPPIDNYRIQAQRAQELFLTYDQQKLIEKCRLRHDTQYLYVTMLASQYRLNRSSGDLQRLQAGQWVSANSFAEIMTLLDWLCDSHPDRYITGRWVNLVTQGTYFHRDLQESADPDAVLFQNHPDAFRAACEALGGEACPGADISYAIELLDGLRILVQLWYGDEEFAPRLRCLWDENTNRYIRYETTWYALGLLMSRLREAMSIA